jgi:HD-like signal output (HDOD) protein
VRDWWRHSIAAALLAQRCGEDLPTDHAYTAALLHGIGQLALFEDAPGDYPRLVERAYAEGRELVDCEREIFHVDHAALAGLILEAWGLPEILCEAVGRHHDAIEDAGLVLAVQAGCAVAEHIGFGRCGCPESADAAAPGAALLANHDLLDSLVVQINQIECSLG